MFCSLFGLSPCDLILLNVDVGTVKRLLQLLNNRFDVGQLEKVGQEFDYVLEVLDNLLVFDYDNREDRVLSKKLSIPNAVADRREAEEHLRNAPKSFTGNVRTGGSVFTVADENAREILGRLYNGRARLRRISEMITHGTFEEEVFFGRSVTWWQHVRNLSWVSEVVAERLKTKDDVSKIEVDSARILEYAANDDDDVLPDVPLPSFGEVSETFVRIGGNQLGKAQERLYEKFAETLYTIGCSHIGTDAMNAVTTAFAYCLKSEEEFSVETAVGLERCGLYFMNAVRADFMIEMLSNLSVVPERRISLADPSFGDGYRVMFSAVLAAVRNAKTEIGEAIV
ncbi:hypothetical protein AGMMS49975_10050 [Clostridia bacterium]|nr:hypothetical protein AGMMS49975_10050 [Clostridia bacterium]